MTKISFSTLVAFSWTVITSTNTFQRDSTLQVTRSYVVLMFRIWRTWAMHYCEENTSHRSSRNKTVFIVQPQVIGLKFQGGISCSKFDLVEHIRCFDLALLFWPLLRWELSMRWLLLFWTNFHFQSPKALCIRLIVSEHERLSLKQNLMQILDPGPVTFNTMKFQTWWMCR